MENPLKEYAHLFATGKFQVLCRGLVFHFIGWHDDLVLQSPDQILVIGVEECDLIARPIEAMTDEECKEFIPITGFEYDVETFKEDYSKIPLDDLRLKEFNAFSKIGVVNYSQLFKDGTVIDSREVSDA